MKNGFDIIYLPLHRDMPKNIASEIYWAFVTFHNISSLFNTCGCVGWIDENVVSLFKDKKLINLNIDHNRTLKNDLKFYMQILKIGILYGKKSKVIHHYGSFGYEMGFNPYFLWPLKNKESKYIVGPILYPTYDDIDTFMQVNNSSKFYKYGFVSRMVFSKLHELTLKNSTTIIYDSTITKNLYERKYNFIREKKSVVMPGGGVDENDFEFKIKKPLKRALILGIASNLIKRKNVDKIIIAISKRSDEIILKILGNGPEMVNLKNLSKTLGIEEKVEFLGFREHSLINSFYNEIDYYVALDEGPSLCKISLQEAIMSGTPTLSGEPNMGNGIKIEDWGVIVNPKSESSLNIGINELVKNYDKIEEISLKTRFFAEKTVSTKSVINELSKIYNEK